MMNCDCCGAFGCELGDVLPPADNGKMEYWCVGCLAGFASRLKHFRPDTYTLLRHAQKRDLADEREANLSPPACTHVFERTHWHELGGRCKYCGLAKENLTP